MAALYGLLDQAGPLHSASLSACLVLALVLFAHLLWCVFARVSPSRVVIVGTLAAPLLYAGVSSLYVASARDAWPAFQDVGIQDTLWSIAVAELTYTHAVAGLITTVSSMAVLLATLAGAASRRAEDVDWRSIAVLVVPLLVAGMGLFAVGAVSMDALEAAVVLRETGRETGLLGLLELIDTVRHGAVIATALTVVPVLCSASQQFSLRRGVFVATSLAASSIGLVSLDYSPGLVDVPLGLLVEAEAIENGHALRLPPRHAKHVSDVAIGAPSQHGTYF